jgi:molecular chaperone GrpE
MDRIPIRFADEIVEDESGQVADLDQQPGNAAADSEITVVNLDEEGFNNNLEELAQELDEQTATAGGDVSDKGAHEAGGETAGPVFAELIATRAELKRVQSELDDLRSEATELRDGAARRQADFDNFRKRIERERSETYNRAVADLVAKLLPVLDNLRRAVDTEASVEASESDEFRHFLNGVDLIHKQLGGVLEALGVKAVSAVGERFDPHLHEAVVTEETDEHEPDTVIQEIVRGYRLGDRLLRPALVKVAVKK